MTEPERIDRILDAFFASYVPDPPPPRPKGWECSSCPRAFTTPQGLSNHRRAAHP